jgi:ferrochelatase
MSKTGKNRKIAVILFNLGGPDKLSSVRPFLYNLFSDKWIIRAPWFIRYFIAFFISSFRYKSAQENYSIMGGKSPLLEETTLQKDSLEKELKKRKLGDIRVFISMRYWHPFAQEVIEEIEDYNPDEIIYLPLYPQLSSSTTVSSFEEFDALIKRNSIKSKVRKIGCYYDNEKFINTHIKMIREEIEKVKDKKKLKILFSAHSIPKKFVTQGDPYEWQIRKCFEKIAKDEVISKYDNILCYQSKVGPIEWLSPSTEHVIEHEAKHGNSMIVVPIAFVSEHIETLVELDFEYAEIAKKHSVEYRRVKALGNDINFIKALADFCEDTVKYDKSNVGYGNKKCPDNFINCACRG